MAEPSRLDIINKLEDMSDLSKGETLDAMTSWANQVSSSPDKIINDLESYSQYASKS